jgi:predicted Zn-dependent protease
VIDNETVEFLAYIRADLKQYNAAAELLQRLLTKDPSRRDLRLLWADMLHQAHRYRESESVLAALLEI